MTNKIIFIKWKQAAFFAALLLLALLCIFGRMGKNSEQPVMSYLIANQTIVLDAGHGGMDPGTSHNNLVEKEITLSISKKLARHLSQAGAHVINLRKTDADLCGDDFKGTIRQRKRKDLALRVDRAIASKADLYISIHTNADLSPQWSGAQTFYKAGKEKSELLAVAIQEEFKKNLDTKRETKTGKYFILDRATMPAVIVEVGFLSNPREAKLLSSSAYQDKVAYAIFCGIVKSQIPDEKSKTK